MMETIDNTSFYHDLGMKNMKNMKSSLSLDFNSGKSSIRQKKVAEMLNSPDLNMLKLASPELERLIIQQGGVMATTPTPNTQIMFPRSVTEEQEAYARGFVDALAELHKGEIDPVKGTFVCTEDMPQKSTYTTLTTLTSSSNSNPVVTRPQVTMTSAVSASQPSGGVYTYKTVTELPGSVLPTNSTLTTGQTTGVPSSFGVVRTQEQLVNTQPISIPRNDSPLMQFSTSSAGQHSQLSQIKEEPQRVPSLSPQLTPINMVHQEVFKLERKRARNRIAARKCRTRKLERISRLEDRVSDLKGHNGNLVQAASDLRDQVMALKQQILQHVKSGCKVMLSANML